MSRYEVTIKDNLQNTTNKLGFDGFANFVQNHEKNREVTTITFFDNIPWEGHNRLKMAFAGLDKAAKNWKPKK